MSVVHLGIKARGADERAAFASAGRAAGDADFVQDSKFGMPHPADLHNVRALQAEGLRGEGITVMVIEPDGVPPTVCLLHSSCECECTAGLRAVCAGRRHRV